MQGYVATTIQQYLSDHPVDENDMVHVEDGGWVNPDGDFGSPQSLKWNYPLVPRNAQVSEQKRKVFQLSHLTRAVATNFTTIP